VSNEVLHRIHRLLDGAGVAYSELEHAPTRTSREAAAARGEDLATGAKALLLKTDDVFRLFVLPADRKLSSRAIRHHLHVSRTRFATRDELLELTGLVPGCVPPFGEPILPFELYADEGVGAAKGRVAFNAGSLTHSIGMAADDWERIARPVRFRFSKA
jgi:prolyl-tRNA editing enzyme YbaK/EbsC (Cys-tRNA(Pro) deacylase)